MKFSDFSKNNLSPQIDLTSKYAKINLSKQTQNWNKFSD